MIDAVHATRDGHLTDLALLRYSYDPPSAAAEVSDVVRRHAAICQQCRRRLELLGGRLPAPGRFRAPRPRRRKVAAVIALGVAAALAFAIIPRGIDPGLEEDVVRVRGTGFDVRTFVFDGRVVRAVSDADVIRPGDRVRFELHATEPGWVLVAGVDDSGAVYPCVPQAEDAGAIRLDRESVLTPPASTRFDATGTRERLVAIYCDRPFALNDVRAALARAGVETPAGQRMPALRDGCAQREVELTKEVGAGGP